MPQYCIDTWLIGGSGFILSGSIVVGCGDSLLPDVGGLSSGGAIREIV
ncbi:hypothetical protein B1P99_004284 [Salmonella enterica subsp. enterica serovar Gaminara]|nr:hypothetical protein [Salmonella enterica subsp. enterica serovar Gaminara]